MDLRQLRTFLKVAQLGSLTKAADHLRIAQPAVGRQIHMLEQDLGVRLFDRHGRGMALTDKGRQLVERATAILRMAEETRAELSAEQGAVRGAVCLGVPPTAGEVIAGRLVERFLRDYPDVTVRIAPAFSGFLAEMLQRGEIDLGVMYEGGPIEHARTEPLIAETLFLIGPQGAGLHVDNPVAFAQLEELALVLPGYRHGLRQLIENQAEALDVALKVVVEADALQTLRDLVARRLGYTILPLAAVHDDVKSGALCAAPLAKPELSRKLVLAQSIVHPMTNAARVFAQTLKSETADMVRTGVWQGELLSS